MPIKKTNQEQLPIVFEKPNVNTLVNENDEVIKLRGMIEQLDFSKFYQKIGKVGAPSYKPEVMLGIIIMAISDGIMSSRKIENRCKKDLDYIFITDWGSPDHSTIARFISNNKEEIIEIGKQFVLLAKSKGMGRFKEFAMDGTKIGSYSSKNHSYGENKLEEQIQRIEKTLKKGLEIIKEADIQEEEKEKQVKKNNRLKKYLEECKESKVKLIERKKALRPENRKNHQINVKEPESRYISEMRACGYNVQYITDTTSGLIVANDVISDQNDARAFKPNVENVESIIGEDTERKYIADSSYSNGATLAYVKEREIEAVINDIMRQEGVPSEEAILDHIRVFNYQHFFYIKEENRYLCPNHKYLEEEETNIYVCKECEGCKYKDRCCKKTKAKKIKQSDFQKHRIEMMGKADYTSSMNRRKIVERKFGQLKWNLKFRRFTRKHLLGAKVETALIALSINIYSAIKHYFFPLLLILTNLMNDIFDFSTKIKQERTITLIR